MTKTTSRLAREGVVSFGDASLSIWEEGLRAARDIGAACAWERQFKREVFARIIQTLNRLGWTCVVPEDYVKQYGLSFARNRRECHKGDLKGWLEICGRTVKFETWQGVNTPTRPDHGGRYESNKEACMPYVLRLEMERTRRRIRDYLLAVFTGYTFNPKRMSWTRRPLEQTAAQRIADSYAESSHFRGDMAAYLARNGYDLLPSYNCTSLDGERIQHGDRVWFRHHSGRVFEGTAFYNINNMWWVVTGRYDLHNVGTHDIWTRCPTNPRVKRNERERRRRLENLMAEATKGMQFERAALFRDLLFQPGQQLYVIRGPQDTYWAPGSCGYRNDIVHAGRYTLDEARRILGPDLKSGRGDHAIPIN